MKRFLSALAVTAAAVACTDKLTVVTDDGTSIRLQPVSESIIRVSAVPAGAAFSQTASLVAITAEAEPEYSIEKSKGLLTVTTSGISASVNRHTGCVEFRDASGKLLTSEYSRSFEPIEADGHSAYTVTQSFESPADEAFYGLGQHQAGDWNYKGRNEELYQYNTKISVPFVVSTKGYGLLWDSYSFCRWGDTRDYAPLDKVFRLYDKTGAEGSLTGTYTPARGKKLIRSEVGINQEYLCTPECDVVKGAPEGFNFDGSKVIYEGSIEPAETGTYRFRLYYAGYIKVFIDGKQVIPEIWRTAWNPNSCKFDADLEAGVQTHIRIEWTPDGSVSYCSLRALSPVPEAEQTRMSWWGEMQDQIDYYIIAGATPDKVISGYRTLTGKAPVMPKWAMGYWQSRERYTSQEQICSVVDEFRKRHIPIDNIVQDWQYWKDDAWGSHEFDPSRFPDPQQMIDDIHSAGARYMISVWPKFYTGTEHFKEFDDRGWMYRGAVTDSVEDWLGYQQSFYDAYSEGARKLFWDQMNEHLYKYGIDAWWMDASEPNIHDCTDMAYRKFLCGPTALGSSTQYFNAYALLNAKAIYEGQRSVNPDSRVFLLTRNGFAGLQRYSTASWSGDIGCCWEDMRTQIGAGLNYSLSGIPFWGQDIGGFSVQKKFMEAQSRFDRYGEVTPALREWRELQTRWFQFGTFVPLFRSHGQWPAREPWNIAPAGSRAYESILWYNRLRYRLMPYIYTMAGRVHFDDYTIMRALVMDYTDDLTAREISDEYMFGDAFLVCPVCEFGARSRQVYLPEDGWYEFESGRFIEGGQTITAAAPYERIPLYVRAGSIVPTGPAIEYTAQETSGELEILVYSGTNGAYTLYEDDGTTYAYERGAYSMIDFWWNDASRKFTIGNRKGSAFDGMHAARSIKVTIISPEGSKSQTVEYNGKAVEIEL